MKGRRFLAWIVIVVPAASCPPAVSAQNVVVREGALLEVAEPVEVTEAQVDRLVRRVARFGPAPEGEPWSRVREKLEHHVQELLDHWPLRPLHHTLGISGFEVKFGHPDELFHALSMAHPFLEPRLADRVRLFLDERLRESPPYAMDGFDPRAGASRESYDVPETLRNIREHRADSCFGVYAFWSYCHYLERSDAVPRHWQSVVARLQHLLDDPYVFDPAATAYRENESERLNGDLAGLIGFVRLARRAENDVHARAGLARLRQFAEIRVNLDRVNPMVVEPSRSASNQLHYYRLTRYGSLTPEVAALLAEQTQGLAAKRLERFRASRNGWFLVLGDRMIGGENYTNPFDFPRALFAGAALIEQLPAERLVEFIDVPACRGDLYFLERCAVALWVGSGRAADS